jgi:LPPG:FO 2-phospho-L-lactate transferase
MITVLSGGTGGAKFIQGLARVIAPDELTIIVNTGDDLTWWGLHVSPDIDSVNYGLAGLLSAERGWGIEGETFACLEAARHLGLPTWFQLGDRDLALHLARTEMLRSGKSLSEATAEITRQFGITAAVLPMTNDRVETRVLTSAGELSFQEYFVRERYQPAPLGVRYSGAEVAEPAPGVLRAIAEAEGIIIAPSNPITSVGPILSLPAVREALRKTQAPIAAISPIIGSAAVSGPAAALMRCAGFEVSFRGVAATYADFLDVIIADQRDAGSARSTDVFVQFCDTIMVSNDTKDALARAALSALDRARARELALVDSGASVGASS